jgi:uncharacterized protein
VNSPFAPFQALADALLPQAGLGDDGAHDLAHLQRVWVNAFSIARIEGGEGELIAAAVLLHDCVAVEKNSPLRPQASRLAADRAAEILTGMGWDGRRVASVHHAIAAHSFSASIRPESIEAQVLQDADRLDAIGMIGVARCFYTAGRMGSALYSPNDPRAEHRDLDDRAFALDHFRAKLLNLKDGFQTATGQDMATERTHRIAEFMVMFEQEIGALT